MAIFPDAQLQQKLNLNRGASGQNLVHNSPVDICGTELSAGMLKGQLFVIEAQQVQYCRMQIMHVHTPLNGTMTNFISASP